LVDSGVILDFFQFFELLLHLSQRSSLRLIFLNLSDSPPLKDTLSFLLSPLILVIALDVELEWDSQVIDEGKATLSRLLLLVELLVVMLLLV
jgi:hypothetical protein